MIAVHELYQNIAKTSSSPIVIFNGELDRIRSGYYPALFFPKLGKLAKTFIPHFESAFYIHNFKGNRGGMSDCFCSVLNVLHASQGYNSSMLVNHVNTKPPASQKVAMTAGN